LHSHQSPFPSEQYPRPSTLPCISMPCPHTTHSLFGFKIRFSHRRHTHESGCSTIRVSHFEQFNFSSCHLSMWETRQVSRHVQTVQDSCSWPSTSGFCIPYTRPLDASTSVKHSVTTIHNMATIWTYLVTYRHLFHVVSATIAPHALSLPLNIIPLLPLFSYILYRPLKISFTVLTVLVNADWMMFSIPGRVWRVSSSLGSGHTDIIQTSPINLTVFVFSGTPLTRPCVGVLCSCRSIFLSSFLSGRQGPLRNRILCRTSCISCRFSFLYAIVNG